MSNFDNFLKVLKTIFYTVGILTCIIVLNFKGNVPNKTYTPQTKEVQVVEVKNTIQHNYITPNTIGALFLFVFSILIMTGFVYFLSSTKKAKTNKDMIKLKF